MRLLHTMLRVGSLQRSIDFYTRVMGMKLLRTTERPEQKYSLAFVGYGNNPEHAEIELTENHGVDPTWARPTVTSPSACPTSTPPATASAPAAGR